MPHQLLLADDSVTIQRVIKLTFADEDIEVVTVGDGNLAVEAIDRRPPDIVLADVAMPGRSGYEVAQHIRTSPGLAHIPVLLLTGAFEPVDEARASEIGCDGVLAKPFEPDAVVSRVKELLATPRAADAKPLAPKAREVNPAVVAAPQKPASAAPAASAPVPPPLVFPAKAPATAAAPVAAVASAAAPRQASSDVDAYFDRLDQAFATLALSPRAADDAQPPSADHVPASPFARAAMPAAFAQAAPAAAVPSMALDDVFAALSAAPAPPSTPAPVAAAKPTAAPSPVATAQAAGVTLTEAQLEQIVNRVLERLTSRLGNPAEIVANVAERVVREEIAQIKGRM